MVGLPNKLISSHPNVHPSIFFHLSGAGSRGQQPVKEPGFPLPLGPAPLEESQSIPRPASVNSNNKTSCLVEIWQIFHEIETSLIHIKLNCDISLLFQVTELLRQIDERMVFPSHLFDPRRGPNSAFLKMHYLIFNSYLIALRNPMQLQLNLLDKLAKNLIIESE